jgi:hypothetical protein
LGVIADLKTFFALVSVSCYTDRAAGTAGQAIVKSILICHLHGLPGHSRLFVLICLALSDSHLPLLS